MCTHYFLNDIYEGEVFSWNMEDIRMRNCATMPNIQDLRKLTVTSITDGIAAGDVFPPGSIDKVTRLQEHISKRAGSKRFYLEFLSTLHARGLPLRMFAKNFVYRPAASKDKVDGAPPPAAFFQGLPNLTEKQQRLRGHKPAQPRDKALAEKLAR